MSIKGRRQKRVFHRMPGLKDRVKKSNMVKSKLDLPQVVVL